MQNTLTTSYSGLSGFLEMELDLLGSTPQQTNKNSLQGREGLSFLIVDDNSDMLEYIGSSLLAVYEEAKIVYANDGEQAIQEMAGFQPDLIITDWDMPLKNGFDIAREIEADPAKKGIPILMVTGIELNSEIRMRMKSLHIHSVLSKPFDAAKLIAHVRGILNENSSNQEL